MINESCNLVDMGSFLLSYPAILEPSDNVELATLTLSNTCPGVDTPATLMTIVNTMKKINNIFHVLGGQMIPDSI